MGGLPIAISWQSRRRSPTIGSMSCFRARSPPLSFRAISSGPPAPCPPTRRRAFSVWPNPRASTGILEASWVGVEGRWRLLASGQGSKEIAVALHRDPKVLGIGLAAAGPLRLELGSLGGEHFREMVDHLGNQAIGLLNGAPRIIDESRLDRIPPAGKILPALVLDQPIGSIVRLRFWAIGLQAGHRL